MSGSRPLLQRRLELRNVEFGKTDARYEVLTRDERTKEHFKQSFLEPSGISVDEFKDGSRFFVYGAKGAGKTALLRYVQLDVEASACLTHFVTFSTDITEDQREKLTRDAGFQIVDQDADPGVSAINVWILHIFRILTRLIEDNRRVFASHRGTVNFCALIKKVFEEEEQNGLSWLADMVKRGKYKVKAKLVEATLQGKAGDAEKTYDLSTITQCCFSFLRDLSWEGPRGIYIFFDELNLSFSSRAQHKRDAILLRDLILAVDKLNSFFIEQGKQIYILAAARSEVLQAISVPTHEIVKCLTDRGRELRWFARTAGERAPIVSLFEKKVHTSERMHKRPVSADVLDAYFRRSVYGLPPDRLIVELTWCNPRDIISLFGQAAKVADGDLFDEVAISRIIEDYSAKAWGEKVEELNVDYAAAEVQSLKKVLMGCNVYFRRTEFELVLTQRAENDDGIRQFRKKRNSAKVLESLYRIGILGQSTRRPNERELGGKQFEEHWAYRGDNNFDPDSWMVMHRAVWPNLRKGRIFGNR